MLKVSVQACVLPGAFLTSATCQMLARWTGCGVGVGVGVSAANKLNSECMGWGLTLASADITA